MKANVLAAVIVFCALACAVGCASTRQFVPLPDQQTSIQNADQGRIYVLRPERLLGTAARMQVRDGDRPIGDLGTHSYLCWERAPGKTTVFLDFHTMDDFTIAMPEELDVQRGQVYYLRAGLLSMNPVSTDTNLLDRLWRLDDAEGKLMLQKCNPPPRTAPASR